MGTHGEIFPRLMELFKVGIRYLQNYLEATVHENESKAYFFGENPKKEQTSLSEKVYVLFLLFDIDIEPPK